MNQRLFDSLRSRLRKQGMSRRYVDRLTAELADHYESTVAQYVHEGFSNNEAERMAQDRLGCEEAIYEEIIRRKELRPFVRRFPVFSFVVGPISALVGVVGVFSLLGIALALVTTRFFDVEYTDPVFRTLVLRGFYTFVYIVTPMLAAVFCFLAIRHRCSPWLALIACVLLCVAGGMVRVDLVLCPASGSVMLFHRLGVDLIRICLPLAIFGFYFFYHALVHGREKSAIRT